MTPHTPPYKEERELEKEELAFTEAQAKAIREEVMNFKWFHKTNSEDHFYYKMRMIIMWWWSNHMMSKACDDWRNTLGTRLLYRNLEPPANFPSFIQDLFKDMTPNITPIPEATNPPPAPAKRGRGRPRKTTMAPVVKKLDLTPTAEPKGNGKGIAIGIDREKGKITEMRLIETKKEMIEDLDEDVDEEDEEDDCEIIGEVTHKMRGAVSKRRRYSPE